MSVFDGNKPRRSVELWPEDRVPTNNLERLIASANPYIKKERDEAERLKAEVDARCRAEGGDGAPEAVSADRAQQGEPVDGAGGFWRERVAENAAAVAAERGDTTSMFDEFRRLRKIPKTPGYCDGTKYTEREAFNMAIATKAAAPADAPKDHEIREAINQLRDVAVKSHAAQQLRERIAGIVLPLVKGRAADTGIPTAGDVETTIVQDVADLFAASGFEVRPDNGPLAIAGSLDAAGVLVNAVIEHFRAGAERFDWSRKGMVLDPQGFYVHYRRSDDLNLSGRAPISSTPTSGAVEKAGNRFFNFNVSPTLTKEQEAAAEKGYCPVCNALELYEVNVAHGMRFCQCNHCKDIVVLAAPSHPSEAKAGEDA